MNKACIAKLGWNFKREDKALWCREVRGKYEKRILANHGVDAKVQDSSLWKNIVDNWELLESMSIWLVGDGISVRAQEDCWLGPGIRLEEYSIVPIEGINQRNVSDCVTECIMGLEYA